MNSDKLETRDKRKQAGTIKLSARLLTVAGFVNQVLAHHFEENGGLINAVLEKYYQSLKS